MATSCSADIIEAIQQRKISLREVGRDRRVSKG